MIGDRDRRAFDAFVTASSSRLLRTAYLLCGDREHAEDLVQTTLLRTARRWQAARRRPEAYARQVLVNLAKDRWRELSRRPCEAPIRTALDVSGAPADTDLTVDREQLMSALGALPEGQRAVVVLRFFDDLSVEDTAATLHCTTGTVKSQTFRALKALRAALVPLTESTEGPQHAHR